MTSPRQRKKRLAFKKLLEKQREAENNKPIQTPMAVAKSDAAPVQSKPVEPPKVKKPPPKNALVEIEPLKQKESEKTVTPDKTEVKEEKTDV